MIKYNIGMGDKYMKNKIKVIIRIIIILLVVVLIFLITNYLIHKNDCCSCCPEGSNTCIEMCCKCKGAIFNGRQEYINATAKNTDDSIVCKNGHTGDTLTCSNIAFTTSGGNSDMLVLVVVGSGDSAVTYTLSIIKPAQQNTSDNGIASIKIGDVTATKGSTGTYTITLKDVVEYTIEATLNDPANYKFSDETLTYLKPYTFSNENGEDREIPLIVVPKDNSSGLASATYFLIVKQSNSSSTPTPTPTPSGNNTNNNPQTGVGSTMMGIILIVSFIASIYLYKRNLNSYN